MLRLWWQQPCKQTKSECSALRPDKRGKRATCCALCVRERKTQTPTRTKTQTQTQTWEQQESRDRREWQTDYLFSAAFLCLLYFRYFCLPPLPFFLSLFLFFFAYSLYLQSVWAHPALTARLPPAMYMNDEYSHTYSPDIHIDKVLSLSRRASLLYETNLEQLTEEVESGEWRIESHCVSTAVITAYTAYHKSI